MQIRSRRRVYSAIDLQWYEVAVLAVLSIGSLYLLFQTVLSLQWPLVHDGAFLHTIAYLINTFDLAPYRDIFETTMPLGILIHVAITKAAGYGDLAFRVVDIAYLAALLFVTHRMMRPLGPLVAWAAALVFGLLYQSYGPQMSLQRDYLVLLPVAAAIWLGGRTEKRGWHFVVIGALFGLAASVKPQFAIGLPPVLVYALASRQQWIHWRRPDWPDLIKTMLLAGGGAALAALPPFLWVWRTGGLTSWWAMLTDYLPLYNELSGNHKVLGPRERYLYLFQSTQLLGGQAALLIPATLGVYIELTRSRLTAAQRRLIILLVVLTLLYVVYVAIGGKFWTYHWMPFFYFATCCAVLIVRPLQDYEGGRSPKLLALSLFAASLLLILRPAPDLFRQLSGQPPLPAAGGRVALMTNYLADKIEPGDTIQPIDGLTGGGSHALMRVGGTLATPYINRTPFYHAVSTSTIQAIRADFLARLANDPPRFITDVPAIPPPSGVDTDDFPALKQFIAEHYRVVLDEENTIIYEWIEPIAGRP